MIHLHILEIEKQDAKRVERISEVKNRKERAKLSTTIREEIDDGSFAESCEYYGIEPFEIE